MTAALAAAGAAVSCAGAQPAPAAESGRYSFSKTDEGYLRLDTRTGQVSLCGRRTIGWTCQLVPDERLAMEGEIARLQDEVSRLKTAQDRRPADEIARAEPQSPNPREKAVPPAGAEQPPAANPPTVTLPSDEELDRMMTFIEKVWRRLVDMMGNLQKDPRRT